MNDSKYIGKPVRRIEDRPLLTGDGRFVGDLRFSGTLEAAFVRSPHAHARIRSIDTSAARRFPNVHAVLTFRAKPAEWTAVAKDGADLPASQRVRGPARIDVMPGETVDYEF